MTANQLPLPDFDAQWDFGKPAETEARFRAIMAEAEPSGKTAYLLELKTQISRTLGLQGRFEDAHEMLDSIEPEITPEMPRVRVRYLLERGRAFNSSDHAEKAKPLFIEAWELARRSHQDNLAVDSAHMVAITESGTAAEEWNLEALAFANKSPDPAARQWRASLYNNLGWTYHDAGRLEEALAIFHKALAAREEMGRDDPTRIARWTVARCLRSLGRAEEALVMQQEQVALLEAQKRDPAPFVCEEMAECLHALGRIRESRPWFASAYAAISKDEWIAKRDAPRLERLKRLSLEQK